MVQVSALHDVLAMDPRVQPGLPYGNATRRAVWGGWGSGKTWILGQLPAYNAPLGLVEPYQSGDAATEQDLDCLIAEAQLVPGDMAAPDDADEAAERSAVIEAFYGAQVEVIVQRDD